MASQKSLVVYGALFFLTGCSAGGGSEPTQQTLPPPLPAQSLVQQAYVKASNAERTDGFGGRVALDGNTLAIGVPNEDSSAVGVNDNTRQTNNFAQDSGAVYVFTRSNSNGVWVQEAYVKASSPGAGDGFGRSVALDGDTLVVGAAGDDNGAVDSGAAYVFVRSPTGVWTQQAYVKASNVGEGDGFGRSVALDGDTLVVGAPGEDNSATGINSGTDDDGAAGSGAAYVFTRNRSTGEWTQQAYVKASNTGDGDGFGDRVALAGDTLAVGAPLEDSSAKGINGDADDNNAVNSGAVYVFVRSPIGVWTQQGYVKASNTGVDDRFGGSVALAGDTLAVGAPLEDSSAKGINGDADDNNAVNSGAVYVFVRSPIGVWTQQAYVKASNTEVGDGFGGGVALVGNTLAVGAPFEDSGVKGINGNADDNGATDSGAGYVFVRRSTGGWVQQAYVKASNTESGDGFGGPLAVSGDTLVFGASSEDGNATGVNGNENDNSAFNSGAVYVMQWR